MIKKILFLALVAIGLFFTSCSSDDDNNNGSTTKNITLNISGLEDLGSDFVYEGWIIVNSVPVSTGTFTSTASSQTFVVDEGQLNSATRFVLTIEPVGETGVDADKPSNSKLVAGDFSSNTATVSIATVGDFTTTTPSGKFFLRSPTDEATTNNNNDESGIWFGTPDTPTLFLTLPTLEVGWKYEGWVVVDGVGPLSTGTFTESNIADDNAGATGSFSGTENTGPPLPGEDFFNNAPAGFTFPLDIRNRLIIISVEPFPDNSPSPFLLKPLQGTAGDDFAPETYDLSFDGTSFPTGTVTR